MNFIIHQSFSLSRLKTLKKLNTVRCGLKKVPVGLENCINLEVLHDLAHNEGIGQQSFSISRLKNLIKLKMSDCGLKKVPHGLNNCINLKQLILENKQLKQLPTINNFIKKGVKFKLQNNILEKPPQVICDDPDAILNYFESIAKFGVAHSKRLRVLVIGNSGAGKTSLVNRLLLGKKRLTEEDERTEGVEIRKWYPDPANEDLELEIWDFGGHMEYQSVSHYFFEEHSLFLLVVDVSEYETTDNSYHEKAGKWIDELKSIVRRPVVLMAATKSDLVYNSVVRDRCLHMLEKIAEQEKLDKDSTESDISNIVQTDSSNSARKEKLNLLKTKRPVLPK